MTFYGFSNFFPVGLFAKAMFLTFAAAMMGSVLLQTIIATSEKTAQTGRMRRTAQQNVTSRRTNADGRITSIKTTLTLPAIRAEHLHLILDLVLITRWALH